MYKIKFILFIVLLLISTPSFSAIYDRGGGLIYDDVNNITWLWDVNYITTSGWSTILINYNQEGRVNWNIATIWADELDYGGYTDWRLPTKAEIEAFDSIDISLFINYYNFGYWTSTQSDYGDEYKWYFIVPTGTTDIAVKAAAYGAWVVRTGDTVSGNKMQWVEGGDFELVEGGVLEWVNP